MRIVWLVAVVFAVAACDSAARSESSAVTPDSPSATVPPAANAAAPPVEPAPVDELRLALEQMLRGSSPQSGEVSWFSPATADALRSVSVDSTGHAIVDFEDLSALIPNASSSAGSAILLDEMKATVFSVNGIRSVEYRIEDNCERFWEWLQYGGCQIVDRP